MLETCSPWNVARCVFVSFSLAILLASGTELDIQQKNEIEF